jgi:uncharacterized protein (DUF1800 family)
MLKPLTGDRWNAANAAHLLNRAGFGGNPADVERLARLAPEAAVGSLVDFERQPDSIPAPEWAKPDPDRFERLEEYRKIRKEANESAPGPERDARAAKALEFFREEAREQQRRLMELRGWWLKRMAEGNRPLEEKLTLFWHGHFATSMQKVKEAYYMSLQNQTFRRHAAGNWRQMILAMAKDPAMLIWLDQAQSRKSHPNENFARELMELFTLGEGNYTERDVTESARAWTGWSLNRRKEEFIYLPAIHDSGTKTILGRTGYLTGEDVVDQILKQPQAARFLTSRLWNFFAGSPPNDSLGEALAQMLRSNNYELKPFLKRMFLAEEFYADSVRGAQIKSPVQWLISSVRALETKLPAPFLATSMLKQMGQELFLPPNVKGWDGGLSWINTNSLLTRYNAAAILVTGELPSGFAAQEKPRMQKRVERAADRGAIQPIDPAKLVPESGRGDFEKALATLESRLMAVKLKEKQRQSLLAFAQKRAPLDDNEFRQWVRLIMSTPEYQLT